MSLGPVESFGAVVVLDSELETASKPPFHLRVCTYLDFVGQNFTLRNSHAKICSYSNKFVQAQNPG